MLNLSISKCQARESGNFVPATARSTKTAWRKRKRFAGRPPGVGRRLACLLDQILLFDQPPEVLLVNEPAGERLHGSLQLQQRERCWHQLEHDGPVFDLGSQPGDARCQNAAMIGDHRPARDGRRIAVVPTACGLGHQRGFVKQLVALQDEFLIPVAIIQTEGVCDTLPAVAAYAWIFRVVGPRPKDAGTTMSGRIEGTPAR